MTRRRLAFFVLSVLASSAVAAPPPPPPATQAKPAADPNLAEGRFKNIKAFKGYPADDVVPAMQFMSAALGVDCEFCHVEHEPEKDDKKEKQTARKMIAMTFAINRDHFEGHREVTCMSCHHGAEHPASIPLIGAADRTEEPVVAKTELPAAGAVLDKYVQALGGTDALAKVKSRVQKGSLTGLGPEPVPVDVQAKAPDRRITVVHGTRGDNVTAVQGSGGWLGGTLRPPRDMSAQESEAARLDAALLFGTDIRPRFKELKVTAAEPVQGKDALKVVARNDGKPPTQLWFDAQSGLLLRLVRYQETPLGRNPTQVDYADYRETDGVKIPYRWTVARPSGSFTIQLDSSLQNVPLDDKAFEKPAQAPPS